MERKIKLFNINETGKGLSKENREFWASELRTVVEEKKFANDNMTLEIKLVRLENMDEKKGPIFGLSMDLVTNGYTARYVSNSYVDKRFTKELSQAIGNVDKSNLINLTEQFIFCDHNGNEIEFERQIFSLFDVPEEKKEDRSGFDRAVPRAERQRREATGDRNNRPGRYRHREDDKVSREEDHDYRGRFGHRNSEDHRRNVVSSQEIAKHLLKPVLGYDCTRSFFRENEVVGEIDTLGAKFDRADGGQVITLVVQIKIEDI